MTTTKPSHKKFMMTLVAIFAAGALLGSCASKDDESTGTSTTAPVQGAETKDLKVEDAWARPSAKMTSAGAVYLTIINGTDADDELTGVSVEPEVAATAELHETRAAGSGDMGSSDMGSGAMGSDEKSGSMGGDETTTTAPMMEMVHVDSIKIPAGKTVALEPGGYHIMLMDLVNPLENGSKIKVTLTFKTAGEIVVDAEVRDSAP